MKRTPAWHKQLTHFAKTAPHYPLHCSDSKQRLKDLCPRSTQHPCLCLRAICLAHLCSAALLSLEATEWQHFWVGCFHESTHLSVWSNWLPDPCSYPKCGLTSPRCPGQPHSPGSRVHSLCCPLNWRACFHLKIRTVTQSDSFVYTLPMADELQQSTNYDRYHMAWKIYNICSLPFTDGFLDPDCWLSSSEGVRPHPWRPKLQNIPPPSATGWLPHTGSSLQVDWSSKSSQFSQERKSPHLRWVTNTVMWEN